jgi:hypothetical protein
MTRLENLEVAPKMSRLIAYFLCKKNAYPEGEPGNPSATFGKWLIFRQGTSARRPLSLVSPAETSGADNSILESAAFAFHMQGQDPGESTSTGRASRVFLKP